MRILLKLTHYTIDLFWLRNLKIELPHELGNTVIKILPSIIIFSRGQNRLNFHDETIFDTLQNFETLQMSS